jgi:hypothetical protein
VAAAGEEARLTGGGTRAGAESLGGRAGVPRRGEARTERGSWLRPEGGGEVRPGERER